MKQEPMDFLSWQARFGTEKGCLEAIARHIVGRVAFAVPTAVMIGRGSTSGTSFAGVAAVIVRCTRRWGPSSKTPGYR